MKAGRVAETPIWLSWTLLAGAGLAGFWLADGADSPSAFGTEAALFLAAFKAHLIMRRYMEVRWSHQPLWTILNLWLFAVCAILLGGYWAASAFK